uniref:Thioredoxin domain-containing protein n=1 Tax=viral metagenome TaxID=1070528 RepID=A0A6C0E9L4_9ZZZZ
MRELSESEKLEDVLKEKSLCVVDFFATWCGPCKKVSAELDVLESKHADTLFVKVDVDTHESLAVEYSVESLPTVVVFKDAVKIGSFVGASPKLSEQIAKLLV